MLKRKSPDPIDKHVGSRVRMRRMMLDMSQTALGQAFGVSFQQVQKYEKGMNRMGASRLQQAADILGVSVPFFLKTCRARSLRDRAHRCRITSTSFVSSYDGMRLIKAFMRLDNGGLRRAIVTLVEEISSRDGE